MSGCYLFYNILTYNKINQLIHKFFEALDHDGLINLKLNSIPLCYDKGYPDETRHHIICHHKPYQDKLTTRDMENLIISVNIKDKTIESLHSLH